MLFASAGRMEAIDNLGIYPAFAQSGVMVAACMVAAAGAGAECAGPAALEARLHVHAGAEDLGKLGAWFAQQHQYSCAAEAFRSALKIKPDSRSALDGLAKSLNANGDYASVISLLRPVQLDEPLALDLAFAYAKTEMLDRASEVLARALKTAPSSLPLTSALVTVEVNQSRLEEAARLAGKFAQQHPGNLGAQKLYLRALVLNDQTAFARPLGRKLLSLAPHDFEVLYQNGILEREAHEYAAARVHLQQAVALNPSQPGPHFNLGLVLEKLEDAEGAKDQLQESIALGDTNPQVHFALGGVLHTLGDPKAAEEFKLYQQALQANDLHQIAVERSAEAAAELAKGETKKAVALYREAVEASPQDALLHYQLALALDRMGDTAAEDTELQQAVKTDPSLALAQNQLGYLASQTGDSSSAERYYRLAVEAAPEYSDAWVNLAATLGMENRFPEALQAVDKALKLDPHNASAQQLRQALTTANKTQH
jgi:tetratricopeptide (TPR) repeat protein